MAKESTGKAVLRWANNTIREIREDILLHGPTYTAYLIVHKDTDNIIDYSITPRSADKELFFDERWERSNLFDVLCSFIAAAKNTAYGKAFSPKSVWITAARLVADQTQKEFAEEFNVSTVAVQCWELDTRQPKFEVIMQIAKKYDLPIDLII